MVNLYNIRKSGLDLQHIRYDRGDVTLVNENELQQVIYNVLLMQIRFGTYHYGEHLPTLEEASQLFLVSIDTVRAAI